MIGIHPSVLESDPRDPDHEVKVDTRRDMDEVTRPLVYTIHLRNLALSVGLMKNKEAIRTAPVVLLDDDGVFLGSTTPDKESH